MSVIDTRALPLLAQTIRQNYSSGASLPADVADGTRPLQQYAPRTAPGNYCDLTHYINRLSGVSDLDRATATALIDRIVVFRGATPAIDMVNRFDIGTHCGLSVYVPEIAASANSHNYNQLDWYAHTANPNDK